MFRGREGYDDTHFAYPGELDGIREQVDENLPHAVLVADVVELAIHLRTQTITGHKSYLHA